MLICNVLSSTLYYCKGLKCLFFLTQHCRRPQWSVCPVTHNVTFKNSSFPGDNRAVWNYNFMSWHLRCVIFKWSQFTKPCPQHYAPLDKTQFPQSNFYFLMGFGFIQVSFGDHSLKYFICLWRFLQNLSLRSHSVIVAIKSLLRFKNLSLRCFLVNSNLHLSHLTSST